jgi:solute carrier family 25 (mitochondrial phosphate transporter), member 23/24/25/41
MSNPKTLAVNPTSNTRQSNPDDLLIPRPFIPCLRSDRLIQPPPQTLAEYHQIEGRDNRKRRLRQIWQSLPGILKQSSIPHDASVENEDDRHMPSEKVESFKAMYDRELLLLCKIPAVGSQEPQISWREFKVYADTKEAGSLSFAKRSILTDIVTFRPELWHIFHDELDRDGNGHLDPKELHSALSKAGTCFSISHAIPINLDYRHRTLAFNSI